MILLYVLTSLTKQLRHLPHAGPQRASGNAASKTIGINHRVMETILYGNLHSLLCDYREDVCIIIVLVPVASGKLPARPCLPADMASSRRSVCDYHFALFLHI